MESFPFLKGLYRLLPIGLILAAAPIAFRSDNGIRLLLAAVLFLLLYALRSSLSVILIAFVYLSLLGGIRRGLLPILGYPSQDPLLLVSPLFVMLYFLNKAFARQLPHDTRIARLILGLLFVMGLQIFNPAQGGLEVGLAGAMFYIVPVLWYLVGRDMGSPVFVRRFMYCVIGVALLSSLHGLYQTFFGFSEAEMMWGRRADNIASSVFGTLRPMSTFTHSGEYVYILCKAVLLLWAIWLCTHSFIALLPIPLLLTAAFVVGSRGSMITLLAACVCLYAVQGRTMRSWIPRGMLALVIGVVGMVWSLQRVSEQSFSDKTQDAVRHQVNGLLNPLDEKKSSVTVHSDMIRVGFLAGFSNPLGKGLGSTTIAAMKYGGGSESTELDITNMFVSLGVIGGLYTGVYITVLVNAFRYWHRARSIEALGILGVLIISPGQWLTGGLYAHVMLIWVLIGALDHLQREEEQKMTVVTEASA